ncbi:hypothetical protein HDU97_006600 [Phlyctochytrium planicorne]|nr:hypothetical protein HDU97_006600 [Phlyctochytrium planicorne]
MVTITQNHADPSTVPTGCCTAASGFVTCTQERITAIKLKCNTETFIQCGIDLTSLMNLPFLMTLELDGFDSIPELFPASAAAKSLMKMSFTSASNIPKNGELIPSSIRSYTLLQNITLSGNGLAGSFPDIQPLSNLIYLDLRNNLLERLPETLGQQHNNGRGPLKQILLQNNCFDSASLPLGLRDLNPISRAVKCPEINQPDNGGPTPGSTSNPNPQSTSSPSLNSQGINQTPNPVTSAASNPANLNPTSPGTQPDFTTEDVLATRLFTISGQVFTSIETTHMTKLRPKPTTDNQPGSSGGSEGDNINIAPIVGSAVGTFVVCIACVLLAVFLIRRRRSSNANREEGHQASGFIQVVSNYSKRSFWTRKKEVRKKAQTEASVLSSIATTGTPTLQGISGNELITSTDANRGENPRDGSTTPPHGQVFTFSSPLSIPFNHADSGGSDDEYLPRNENESTNGHIFIFSSRLTLPSGNDLEEEDAFQKDADDNLKETGLKETVDGDDISSGHDDGNSVDDFDGEDGDVSSSNGQREALPQGHFMLTWSASDVEQWLENIGIRDAVIQRFIEQQIDGPMLAALTDGNLEHDLGIESQNTRSALLSSIDEAIQTPELVRRRERDERGWERPPADVDLPPPYVG